MSESEGGPPDSFEERLRAARSRQGLGTLPAAEGDDPGQSATAQAWRIGLRVGIELVSALVVAVAIGWGLDRLLGTRPALLMVFILVGGAAGVLNVWRMFSPRGEFGVGRGQIHGRGTPSPRRDARDGSSGGR
jgi:ATP synthase protein I